MIVLRFEYPREWRSKAIPKHDLPEVKHWLELNPEVKVIESFDYRFNSILAFPDEMAVTEFKLKFAK